jgi:hypothetical protein
MGDRIQGIGDGGKVWREVMEDGSWKLGVGKRKLHRLSGIKAFIYSILGILPF